MMSLTTVASGSNLFPRVFAESFHSIRCRQHSKGNCRSIVLSISCAASDDDKRTTKRRISTRSKPRCWSAQALLADGRTIQLMPTVMMVIGREAGFRNKET